MNEGRRSRAIAAAGALALLGIGLWFWLTAADGYGRAYDLDRAQLYGLSGGLLLLPVLASIGLHPRRPALSRRLAITAERLAWLMAIALAMRLVLEI